MGIGPGTRESALTMKSIKAVFFDLGGVYYSEGFREGLFSIARTAGLDENSFYDHALELVFSSGYVYGRVPEKIYWEQLADISGLEGSPADFRLEILTAFKPMEGMNELVRSLREKVSVALLTDQTNWLYDLDERDGFFSEFDEVISSFEEGFSKRDLEIFRIACERFGLLPEEGVFFDDNPENVQRASDFGLNALLFEGALSALESLESAGVFDERSGSENSQEK